MYLCPYLFFFFLRQGLSLCPESQYIDQSSLKLKACACLPPQCWVLGLKLKANPI